ncbi:hypothetical protein BS17DRAFT_789605 [Gyrodon lividus]|nr:hypothetical protein BS17DRAFT_789605 [Gyrodon lividus]
MEDVWALIEDTLYLDEIVDYLTVIHKTHLSITALHNNLRVLWLAYKMMPCTASQRDEQARQVWRDDIAANLTRNLFAFIDESSKDGRTLIADLAVHHGANVRPRQHRLDGEIDGVSYPL